MTKAKPIPPEIIDRASQHLADHILNLANSMGNAAQNMEHDRKHFGMALTSGIAITDLSARMGLWLAIEIAEGRLVPGIYKSK